MVKSLCFLYRAIDLLIVRKGGNFELIRWLKVFLQHFELYFSGVALSYGCIGKYIDLDSLGSEVLMNLFLSADWISLQFHESRLPSDKAKEIYRLLFVIAFIYLGNALFGGCHYFV